MFTSAKALPENTDLLTWNPLPVSGSFIAPETNPAFSFMDNRGATAFPNNELLKITTSA